MRRKLVLALSLALLIAVALAAAFLGRNFMGAGPIPTRTALAGRLPSAPVSDRRRFKFFYATNRALNGEPAFENRGNKLDKQISTGTFDVLFTPGTSIVPWIWLESKYIEFAGHESLPQDEMLS